MAAGALAAAKFSTAVTICAGVSAWLTARINFSVIAQSSMMNSQTSLVVNHLNND
jgi:hypothetical protein